MGYIAFVPDERSRTLLLQAFPPKHPDVICHHVTLEFGVSEDRLQDITEAIDGAFVEVVGSVYDDKAEALIVKINGCMERIDLGTFHITHSLDRSKGAKPVYSNTLVSNKSNLEWLDGYVFIVGTVQFFKN